MPEGSVDRHPVPPDMSPVPRAHGRQLPSDMSPDQARYLASMTERGFVGKSCIQYVYLCQ